MTEQEQISLEIEFFIKTTYQYLSKYSSNFYLVWEKYCLTRSAQLTIDRNYVNDLSILFDNNQVEQDANVCNM